MSSGLKIDRADTVYAGMARGLSLKNRNWLRHGIKTSAGKIDEMLFDGATIEQLARVAKTTKASVYVHLTHLRKEHELLIAKKEGVFRYDVERMNGKKRKKTAKKRK